MKQTKQLLALVLSVVLLVGLMPTRALAEEIGASQSEEPPGGGDAPVTPVEGVTPTEPEDTNVTEPPEVTEPEIVTEPPEETEETEPTEPAEASEPTEPSGEPEETLPQDAEVDEFTQEQFLEEYAAASTYVLAEALTLTAGLRLEHPLVISSGGSLTVPTGITLAVAGALTLDGGSVRVQSGGMLILETEGQIDIQRGLLKVEPGGSFVSNSDTPAISVTPGSGSVEGIELDAPAAPEETEVPTEPETPAETEVPVETEAPAESEIPEETKAPTEPDISGEAGVPAELDAALEIPTIRIQATDDYRDWYNYDPRWADIPLGSGGSTVGAEGCLVTATTKLMIQAGLKSADTCDVGTFVRWANSNGGFESGTGLMCWGAVDTFCGFVNQGNLLEGSFSSSAYNDTIISWIRQGYHMVISVNGNGHWVAVDEATSLRTGTVYIWDSYPDPTIRTGITLASRFETFSTVHAWTGGTTPSSTPSYTLDLNGFLDGQQCTDISGHGTVDVYINGALAASGVSDYYTELPSGTTYEFRNITPASGHRYNGIYLGSLSGTIGNSSTEVVLSFSTVYNVTYRNSSGDTVKTASKGEYTVEELYDKSDGSYFIGWAYQADATMFDVRPGDVLTLSEDVVLYPVYISHAQATSGEAVLIYNINDFPADGYTIAETTRDVSTTTTESDWSAWSEWSTAAVSGSDTVQVESRTAYGWYYYECPSCHAHMHGYGTCYTWCGGCGATTTAAGFQATYDPTDWSAAQDWYGTTKYYAIINGERWFRWDDGGTQTQYRSRNLVTNTSTTNKTYPAYVIQPVVSPVETFTVTYHANGGSGAPASHSSNIVPEGWTAQQIPGQEVLEEKTQYRSRTKSTQTSTESSLPGWTLYDKSISGYGEWSDWSATPITASETLEVRTETVPAVTKTVWHYSRDTADGYSTYAIGYYGNPEYITLDYRLTAMGTVDGHTRYGSYGTTLSNYWWNEYSEEQVVQAAYTAYSSREIKYNYSYYRWSDWSEYSDTAIAAEDGVEVQTRTVYRYAFGIKLSDTVPVRTGYTFQGWATTPYAATALYQPGDVAAINANTTLYAVWKQDSYTVSYNANGGTGAPANQTKLYGTALTLSSTKPTRANASADSFTVTLDAAGGTVSTNKLTAARTTSYFFQSWNTAANGSGATYAPGASYTANAALTLYAQWSSDTTTASVTLPTPSRTGYTFQGWNTAANGTGTAYSAGAAYTPNANITLYAVWKLNQSVSGTLSLGTARGSTGSEVVVDVTLDKNPGIVALNFHFDYDQGKLEFLGGEEGILTGWTFSTSGNGALWDSDVDNISTGTIAKLRFRILDNAEEGNATIRLTDLMAGNRNEEEIFLATVDGTITISNRIPGDMTDDGKVNIMDLIRLRKYLAGDNVSINLSNADVTGDGKVNVMDLIRLRKYLAGDSVELK